MSYPGSYTGGVQYGSTSAADQTYELDKRPRNGLSNASPRTVFVGMGVVLLLLLIVVPVWNAVALLQDANYVFWAGRFVPAWMIALCVLVVVLYALTTYLFFTSARPQVQTEQTIMMIANIFITLLGLVLMLMSLPLSQQATYTYNNLMHRCDYSEQTHRLYEYSQVLQNIRALPGCSSEFSVERCAGYENAPPYTTFLKEMESTFRCSGFCWRSPLANVQYTPGNVSMPTALPNGTSVSMLGVSQARKVAGKHDHIDHERPLSFLTLGAEAQQANVAKLSATFAQPIASMYPPTLFSDANYQASCEGMAARDMKNFAGDISYQTFFQGIYLVLIAICTGFLKLVGFCIRRDHDVQYEEPKRAYPSRVAP